jgi:hypothetical protein
LSAGPVDAKQNNRFTASVNAARNHAGSLFFHVPNRRKNFSPTRKRKIWA